MDDGVGHCEVSAPGKAEPSVAAVRCPNVGRSDSNPFRIEPEFMKRAEDGAEAVVAFRDDRLDVFEQDHRRSAAFHDPDHVEEEDAAISVEDPGSLAGKRNVLAGETANDEIHPSAIEFRWEGSNVSPDRSRIQGFFFHASPQNRGSEGFPLHETATASSSKDLLDGEVETADAGEERQISEGRTIHKVTLLRCRVGLARRVSSTPGPPDGQAISRRGPRRPSWQTTRGPPRPSRPSSPERPA
jgi:hypothetical protein